MIYDNKLHLLSFTVTDNFSKYKCKINDYNNVANKISQLLHISRKIFVSDICFVIFKVIHAVESSSVNLFLDWNYMICFLNINNNKDTTLRRCEIQTYTALIHVQLNIQFCQYVLS